MRDTWRGATRFAVPALVLLLGSGLLIRGAQQDVPAEETAARKITAGDCTYLNNPEEFTYDHDSEYYSRSDLTNHVSLTLNAIGDAPQFPVSANSIPRKNFIDDAIFTRMATANIQSAPLAGDAEYLRRVYLDLTGRIPSAADVNAFLANTSASKRDALVDSLIGTPEFVDKWTMFLGDLFKNNANATNVNRATQGRDAFYVYMKDAVATNKPYDQIAREVIAASGDSFVDGATNWVVGTTIPMGPAQDTYDGGAVNLASMFLGINTVDCLLCHDGARHLDSVNLWGSKQTRLNMWGLSAYFVRTRMVRQALPTNPNIQKFIVSDLTAGNYTLNTTTGNRSARQPVNGLTTIAPKNPFSTGAGTGIANGESYRAAIARQTAGDLQFARAAVNYVWEKFMVEAFVSPSNAFDLARLDPNNPPPAPWTLQPTNPQLLDQMARWFQQNRFDMRALMSLIAKSNAYQLSATYPGTWDASYVPYYARKYVRRMDAEEIHDAITKATNISTSYVLNSDALPAVSWAMQFPDTREPTRNAAVATFLNAFGRGDRDQNIRRSDGSVTQSLNMLNNTFVMTRIHQNNAGSRVAALLTQSTDPATIIRQLFLNTMSRPATDPEIALFLPMFQQQGTRTAAESLQWILLNKLQFLFNY